MSEKEFDSSNIKYEEINKKIFGRFLLNSPKNFN